MADLKILAGDELSKALTALSGWVAHENGLEKSYKLASFRAALEFIQAVGALAEAQDHHPDLDLRYSTVRARLSTHDAGGITARDTKLAAGMDAILLAPKVG